MTGDSAGKRKLQYGVHEEYEGIRDFRRFDDYLHGWIKPNILKDLETVFEGARSRWDNESHKPGAPGRGDFVLASGLLPIFDHFGALIAKPVIEWIISSENIARVARRLTPDLHDIYAVFANLGRNAIIHGAWPQTGLITNLERAVTRRVETWAFGLSFNANSNPERHNTLHNKGYKPAPNLPAPEPLPQKTLKLVLNVHNLRRRLADAIEKEEMFSDVTQAAFDRVRQISELSGDNRSETESQRNELAKPRQSNERMRQKVHQAKLCKQNTLEKQIALLFAEAERLGALDSEADVKITRDFKGYGRMS